MAFILVWFIAFAVMMFLASAIYSKIWLILFGLLSLIAYIVGYFAHNKQEKRQLYRQRLRARRKYKKLLKGG
jgi:hypothetical protein